MTRFILPLSDVAATDPDRVGIKAMHNTALDMHIDRSALSKLKRFQSSKSDVEISLRLKAGLHKQGVDEPAAALRQKMSYWQRYGNTFNHNTLQTNATQMTPEARGTAVGVFSSALYIRQTAGVTTGALVIDRLDAVPLFLSTAAALPVLAIWFAHQLRRHRQFK
jgi:hypothetical protein